MLPFSESELPQVPVEVAEGIIERIQTLINEVRKDGDPEGVIATLEREFAIRRDIKPSDVSQETLKRAMSYLESKKISVSFSDLNTLLVFIANMLEKLEQTLRFSEYLHENGHERIGDYLSSLVQLTSIE